MTNSVDYISSAWYDIAILDTDPRPKPFAGPEHSLFLFLYYMDHRNDEYLVLQLGTPCVEPLGDTS